MTERSQHKNSRIDGRSADVEPVQFGFNAASEKARAAIWQSITAPTMVILLRVGSEFNLNHTCISGLAPFSTHRAQKRPSTVHRRYRLDHSDLRFRCRPMDAEKYRESL